MELIEKIIFLIINQSRFVRRLILCSIDSFLITLSLFLSNLIIYDNFSGNLSFKNLILIVFLFNSLSLFFYILLGKYNGITKYANSIDLYSLAFKNILINFTLKIILNILGYDYFNFKFLSLLWIIQTVLIGAINFIFRDILQKINSEKLYKKTRVAIYGASSKGAQLAASIRLDFNYKVIAFFDDAKILWGRNIGGIKIYNPKKILKFRGQINKIFLSEPNKITSDKKFELIDKFSNYGIDVLQPAPLEKVNDSKEIINKYRPLQIEDLLARDSVNPNIKLIDDVIKDSVICVTGAGGSIGSEICKQVIIHKPKTLVLLEMSEENLYKIKNQLNNSNDKIYNVKIKYYLGSAVNKRLLNKIFYEHKVEILFHAAAYKHVPIVEENPISGIFNNVISTLSVCKEAKKAKLKKVILVSTDKAVRPTNVMGASKRLAELVVQTFADISKKSENNNIHYSMVRFGNVLGSSGSVVPLFEKQISSGGPITITDKKIIRYFMTIKEASQLVIQAAALSQGGEVFLLDMGKPVKIYDLALKMIKLSGYKIKSEDNNSGDIEIIETGLRPGEKLYEELLIDGKAEKTKHPLIFKARERYKTNNLLLKSIEKLEKDLEKGNKNEVFKTLKKLVPEWKNKAI